MKMNRIVGLLPWKRHDRWRRALSASLDGELDSPEREQLSDHLSGCAACQAYERDLRSMRIALSHMQPTEAPRSFRLTPAMVAAPAAAPVPAQGGVVLRGAQLATALAV